MTGCERPLAAKDDWQAKPSQLPLRDRRVRVRFFSSRSPQRIIPCVQLVLRHPRSYLLADRRRGAQAARINLTPNSSVHGWPTAAWRTATSTVFIACNTAILYSPRMKARQTSGCKISRGSSRVSRNRSQILSFLRVGLRAESRCSRSCLRRKDETLTKEPGPSLRYSWFNFGLSSGGIRLFSLLISPVHISFCRIIG